MDEGYWASGAPLWWMRDIVLNSWPYYCVWHMSVEARWIGPVIPGLFNNQVCRLVMCYQWHQWYDNGGNNSSLRCFKSLYAFQCPPTTAARTPCSLVVRTRLPLEITSAFQMGQWSGLERPKHRSWHNNGDLLPEIWILCHQEFATPQFPKWPPKSQVWSIKVINTAGTRWHIIHLIRWSTFGASVSLQKIAHFIQDLWGSVWIN